MRADIAFDKSTIHFIFTPDEGDKLNVGNGISMTERRCFVTLPFSCICVESIHNDLLALSAVLMVYPFSNDLTMPFGVSAQFSDTLKNAFNKDIGPVDPNLSPRVSTNESVPGLAFSGGVDSGAALALMPLSTKAFFLNRCVPQTFSGNTLYSSEAARYACEQIEAMGYYSKIVDSDLEYLRSPVGFPVDWSAAVPAVLSADIENLDSIAFGTILESAYGIGRGRYLELREKGIYRAWAKLFGAVGLPFNLVTAGVSEVGTSIIVEKSGFTQFTQSCIRGSIGNPCMNCWKCFRKNLCDRAVKKQSFNKKELDSLFKIRGARTSLNQIPIKHENVLTYATASYRGNHPKMLALQKRVRGTEKSTQWMERWYPDSLEFVFQKYQDEFRLRIAQYLDEMTPEDMFEFKNWDIHEVIHTESYRNACDMLTETLQHESLIERVLSFGVRKIRSALLRVKSQMFEP